MHSRKGLLQLRFGLIRFDYDDKRKWTCSFFCQVERRRSQSEGMTTGQGRTEIFFHCCRPLLMLRPVHTCYRKRQLCILKQAILLPFRATSLSESANLYPETGNFVAENGDKVAVSDNKVASLWIQSCRFRQQVWTGLNHRSKEVEIRSWMCWTIYDCVNLAVDWSKKTIAIMPYYL